MRRLFARVRHYVTTRRVTVGIVLVMVALGVGEWWYWDRYVPRTDSLAYATGIGDVRDVKRWLRHDPTLAKTETDGHGYPIAHVAIENHDAHALRVLLDYGAGYDGALHDAAEERAAGCARLLIEAGYDVNQPRKIYEMFTRGNEPREYHVLRPLQVLASNPFGNAESIFSDEPNLTEDEAIATANVLLDAGARVDAREQEQCTALQIAVAHGALGLADVLLHRGADIDARSDLSEHLDDLDAIDDAVLDATIVHYVILNSGHRTSTKHLDWLIKNGASLATRCKYRPFDSKPDELVDVDPILLAWVASSNAALARLIDEGLEVPDFLPAEPGPGGLFDRMIAAGRADHVERLLNDGYDPALEYEGSWTAADTARMIEDEATRNTILSLLREHGLELRPRLPD